MSNDTPKQLELVFEEWKPVVGYEGIYEISSYGRTRRIKPSDLRPQSGHILKPRLDGNGYPYVWLYKESGRKIWKLHRLVALAFLGNPPTSNHVVNHINSIRTDPRLHNLEWVTSQENVQHAVRHGSYVGLRGEKGSAAKLTWNQVHEIRLLVRNGAKQCDVAKIFNVHFGTINSIVIGRTWKE